MDQEFDALIVGAGGAGLWAALELAQAGVPTAVLTKLYPTRSHTGAAQGGVCAALGNHEEDHWEWHMFDTVKGGDYLTDQDAAEVLAREAIETVIELEHMGLPFNRTPDGRIDQRRFGGHTRNFGEGPVRRACFAADRTGHMILQTLYQQCIKAGVHFFDEYHVVDLLFDGGDAGAGGRAAGVVAYRIADGELHAFRAKAVLLATGGFGRMFRITSNAWSLTGDGVALAYRHGVPLQDMEFYQFHPTGIVGIGHPALGGGPGRGRLPAQRRGRALHGALRADADGARPARHGQPGDLPGDPGRPGDRRQGLRLPRRPPPRSEGDRGEAARHHRLRPGLPGRRADHRAGARSSPRPTTRWAASPPTCTPGSSATRERTIVPGLYAAGECACVSVHGANRLGTNSLVDLLVFGRRAGPPDGRATCAGRSCPTLAAGRPRVGPGRAPGHLRERPTGENAARIRAELAA